MERDTETKIQEIQYPLLRKIVADGITQYEFPDKKLGQGFTPRNQVILDIFTLDPKPIPAQIKSRLEPFYPENQQIDVSDAIQNLNIKFLRRGIPWQIKSIHERDGLHYVILQANLEELTNLPDPSDFFDPAEATRQRTGLEQISAGQKKLWEDQARIEKQRTAFNLSKTILTHAAAGKVFKNIEPNDPNVLDFLGGAVSSSSNERPANLGLLAVNDPRVKGLTREETIALFMELMLMTEEVIKSYWNLSEAKRGEDRIILKAIEKIKNKTALTPEAIIKSVIAHFENGKLSSPEETFDLHNKNQSKKN